MTDALCGGGDGLCTNEAEVDGLCDEHHGKVDRRPRQRNAATVAPTSGVTPERLNELAALANAATPGPWVPSEDATTDVVIWGEADKSYEDYVWVANIAEGEPTGMWNVMADGRRVPTNPNDKPIIIGAGGFEKQTEANAAFIAAARTAVPDLIAEVRRLQRELASLSVLVYCDACEGGGSVALDGNSIVCPKCGGSGKRAGAEVERLRELLAGVECEECRGHVVYGGMGQCAACANTGNRFAKELGA